MAKPKVLVTRPVQPEALKEVAQFCEVDIHAVDEPMPQAVLCQKIVDADAVMPCGMRLTEEAISSALRLRVVANIGAGYDNVDLDACTRRGILVTNTPDVLSEATADLAFALLLAAGRRVVEGDSIVRQGKWPHWQWNFLWGADLHGRTLGLYGCGRIGQAVARRARGFSMRVLYHSRNRISADIEGQLGAEQVDFSTLLKESDFLSIHAPLTPKTHQIIGSAEFAMMKPTAVIINTARGSIIDEGALVRALQSGLIRAAGLDVFEHEPKVHPDLIGMSNVVLMPHAGSATAETRLNMALLASTNLIAALNGKRPPNLVNHEAWQKSEVSNA
jgi:lactate dehydrogenase-like 2-hydroxyacid dehydrogenase